MNFRESPEFQKDLKTLGKKIRTIKSDLEPVYSLINHLYAPDGDGELKEYRSLFFDGKRATILYHTDSHEVIKMRLDTDMRSLTGKLRLVFIAVISSRTVTFIELYSKNDKNREDQHRINKYVK